MIIKCFRCDKKINTPNSSNADYVIANDTMARELRETLIALKHNPATLAKGVKRQQINDNEYDALEIPNFEASRAIGKGLAKIKVEMREQDIQKTGIICPQCYRPTDFVIWGIHKRP